MGEGGVGGLEHLPGHGPVGGGEPVQGVELGQGEGGQRTSGICLLLGVGGVRHASAQPPGQHGGRVVGVGEAPGGHRACQQAGQVEPGPLRAVEGADEGRVGVGGHEGGRAVGAEGVFEQAGQPGGGGALGDVGELGGQPAGAAISRCSGQPGPATPPPRTSSPESEQQRVSLPLITALTYS
ncbi:hypothetical protein [Streptomyces albidocamelliae]|uniref:Uncharacterized protein n=1 Tax=Streptomyces albidocamelliae TaxID=2981135 RepID=A0ABY6EH77_9ACTN|nr:hypothetical protein [Streptomyces sp. HUAS 14-6]UXY33281.1 hypothetical protein N8I86_00090 [Streptomyces sp. HUAS 14-6]